MQLAHRRRPDVYVWQRRNGRGLAVLTKIVRFVCRSHGTRPTHAVRTVRSELHKSRIASGGEWRMEGNARGMAENDSK